MLIVVTAAVAEPVSLVEAKAHVRATHANDDTLIGALITTSRETVEQHSGRALASAGYRWASEDTIKNKMRLPLWPVAAVSAVSYEDADGVRQTMAGSAYTLDSDRAVLSIPTIPAGATRLSVSFTVTPTNIPAALKHAILLLVGDLYANTDMTADDAATNPAFDRLVSPYRLSYGV